MKRLQGNGLAGVYYRIFGRRRLLQEKCNTRRSERPAAGSDVCRSAGREEVDLWSFGGLLVAPMGWQPALYAAAPRAQLLIRCTCEHGADSFKDLGQQKQG